MLLTRQNVLQYLVHRDVLPLEVLFSNDIWVSEESHRNHSFKIRVEEKDGFFVKQAQESNRDRERNSTLAREAECYRLAGQNSRTGGIIPRFYDYVPDLQVLIVGLAEAAESLSSFHFRTRRFPVPLAAEVGRRLAQFHNDLGKAVRFGTGANPFVGRTPWVLTPDQLDRYGSDQQSLAQAKVVSIIHDYQDLIERLRVLGSQWKVNGIIHGDMKWANILWLEGESEDDTARITVQYVDLEMADAGNVAWDVAGVLQSYLSLWIQSTPVRAETPLRDSLAAAVCPIELMQPSIRAFWSGYMNTLDLSDTQTEALRLLSVQYAAARLVQTAFEYMDARARITGHGVLCLQLSSNMLADPDATARDVLGLL